VTLAIPPFADVLVPIGIGIGPPSIRHAIPEFADVLVPLELAVCQAVIGSLSVTHAIPEFTDVLVAIWINVRAESIMKHLALVLRARR
jgi:hypothetical protein